MCTWCACACVRARACMPNRCVVGFSGRRFVAVDHVPARIRYLITLPDHVPVQPRDRCVRWRVTFCILVRACARASFALVRVRVCVRWRALWRVHAHTCCAMAVRACVCSRTIRRGRGRRRRP